MSEVTPIDWQIFQDAIFDWLTELSDIVPDAIWEDQQVPQPKEYPFASILVTGVSKDGGIDELRTDTDATRASGKEIRSITTHPVTVALSISFYVDADHLASAGPNGDAMALAEKARASLGMRSVIENLRNANIAIVRELGLRNTSLVVNGEWLRRATFDVLLRTTASMVEYGGYIQKVELENDDFGVDVIVDIGS